MNEPVMVVDFGTSTSSAAVVADGVVKLLREPGGGWSRPSAVCLYGEEILVGTPAENIGRSDPVSYRDELKRDLGSATPILLDQKTFRPEELIAEVLRVLREQGEQLHGSPINRAVLTISASYGPADPRRDLMITAGELAGFAEVELLAEPVAAAHAPITGDPFMPGDVVLVYDFGGGTFDTALVRINTYGAHQVLGHAALDDCGGRDIDARLTDRARELAGEKLIRLLDAPPDDPNAQVDAQHVRMELGELTRRAKHQLTNVATSRDYFRPSRQHLSLDRTELATLVAPEIARTIDCCRDLLARLDRAIDSVAGIVMVGGSSHMPAVIEAVARELGRPLRHTEDPTLAVINGAAQWALRSPARVETPWPFVDGERPLRWKIAGDKATVVRWLVEPGQSYDADTPLVAVRGTDGSLWRLAADGKPGVLAAVHADAGETVVSGTWLVTVDSISAPSVPGRPARVFIHPDAVLDVAFSPDGRRLVTACKAGMVTMWDTTNGTRLLDFDHVGAVNAVTFDQTGRWLATGCSSGVSSLWDIQTGERVHTLFHKASVSDVAFHPGGRELATASDDKTVSVWHKEGGNRIKEFVLNDAVSAVEFSSDGRFLAAGVKNGKVGTACGDSRQGRADAGRSRKSGGRVRPAQLRRRWVAS